MDAQLGSRLILETGSDTVEYGPIAASAGQVLHLGTAPGNDVVAGNQHASRHHAHIEVRRSSYYLVDASTNGTFIQTDDEQISYVHRDALRLWGGGWISLGEPLHVGVPIRFNETSK